MQRREGITAQAVVRRLAIVTQAGALRAPIVVHVIRAELETAITLAIPVFAASRNINVTLVDAPGAAHLVAAVGRACPKLSFAVLKAPGALLKSPILVIINAVRAGQKRGHLIRIIPGAFLADSEAASGTGVDDAWAALRARADTAVVRV